MNARLHSIPVSAEEWAARLGAHDVTADDRAAFAQWLAADPSNHRAYEAVTRLESLPAGFGRAAIADLLAEADAARHARSAPHAVRRWLVPASIAASVALVVIAGFFASRLSEGDSQRVATRHGEQRSLTLPDGSVIQLNTDTQLAYRVDGDTRRVTLNSGEAFFDVAKDPTRPFVVVTPAVEVRVVGTQFSVRTRGTDAVDVVVKEGKVDVVRKESSLSPLRLASPSAAPLVALTPGEKVQVVAAAEKPSQVVAVDAERATAWRSGILDIDAMTLEDVIAEVNRYVPVPFVIDDPSIRALLLSGRFRLNDTESIRFMLRERLGVTSDASSERIALRRANR